MKPRILYKSLTKCCMDRWRDRSIHQAERRGMSRHDFFKIVQFIDKIALENSSEFSLQRAIIPTVFKIYPKQKRWKQPYSIERPEGLRNLRSFADFYWSSTMSRVFWQVWTSQCVFPGTYGWISVKICLFLTLDLFSYSHYFRLVHKGIASWHYVSAQLYVYWNDSSKQRGRSELKFVVRLTSRNTIH